MTPFAELLQQGGSAAWFFIPSAILLGALHGLEPGHSKTMMAAFIVAVRGTVFQAVLLGLAATFSHTLVVWAVALAGLYFFRDLDPETTEPYFQLVSAVVIIGIASWMFWRTWQDRQNAKHYQREVAAFEAKHAETALERRIDTGHGFMSLAITPERPARFRLTVISGDTWSGEYVTLKTDRADGGTQAFTFLDRDGYMESAEVIAEPYDFTARLSLDHGDHEHDYDVSFQQGESRPHDHAHAHSHGPDIASDGYMDAHQLSHANDIRKRFTDRKVTTWQIVLFGLTGGLIPCPAAITVLLLCVQLKEFTLGAMLVLCFSIGLAITLVTVGAVAAISVRQATKRVGWLSTVAGRAPYFSSALIMLVGLYTGYHGWSGLQAQQHQAAPAAVTAPAG